MKKVLSQAEIDSLSAILKAMFPTLSIGMILFELDCVSICFQDDRHPGIIAQKALDYAQRYLPETDFAARLTQLLSESSID